MISPRTTTTYAILGLLRTREWTTYELAKQVRRSLNWFWPRAERKLYDEPKRLAEDGLATASAQTTGKRPKTIYAITEEGRDALRCWLDEPAAPRGGEFEAMVKVFFADAGTLDQLHTTLQRINDEATGRIQQLGLLTSALATDPAFPERVHLNALSVRLQLDQELAVQRWSAWALEETAQWSSTLNPGRWNTRTILDGVIGDSLDAAKDHSRI